MFRGDSALLGVTSEKLPDKLALLWTFKTAAPIKSSAVIAGGKVFIGSGDSNLYALNFKTGAKIWSYKTSGAVDAPPLFANETIFIGSTDGFLYSLKAADGKLNWKYKTDDKILGAPNLVVAASRESAAKNIPEQSA
ncbi:MAG: PQQ-binding-like beta-propeller repeat protein, partial [Limisphaerales bacterium]